MTYWVCHYHIVWATKNRHPWITPPIESCIITTIEEQSLKLKAPILAINTVADHVHVAVDIPPNIAITKWTAAAKGASAYRVNGDFPDLTYKFIWQSGYSVHTFGNQAIDTVIAYIQNQKTHHANNTLYDGLEWIEME